MARKTVRINVPNNRPDALLKLGRKVSDKHSELGANSPLHTGKMTDLGTAITAAEAQHKAAKDFEAKAQAAYQERDRLLGVADGQTIQTPKTGLNLITYARDQLLIAHAGNEEMLTGYGFDVVVGSAKNPVRKAKG